MTPSITLPVHVIYEVAYLHQSFRSECRWSDRRDWHTTHRDWQNTHTMGHSPRDFGSGLLYVTATSFAAFAIPDMIMNSASPINKNHYVPAEPSSSKMSFSSEDWCINRIPCALTNNHTILLVSRPVSRLCITTALRNHCSVRVRLPWFHTSS